MGHRIVIVRWTGRHATALKLALRMSSEAFAERLGAGLRAVAEWSREPDMVPTTVMQHALDTLLSQSDDDAQRRFELLVNGRSSRADPTPDTTATDLTTDGLLDWVDLHAGWQAGTARLQLQDQLAQMTPLAARQPSGAAHTSRPQLDRSVDQRDIPITAWRTPPVRRPVRNNDRRDQYPHQPRVDRADYPAEHWSRFADHSTRSGNARDQPRRNWRRSRRASRR